MSATHTEAAFEDAIEAHLLTHGWVAGTPSGYDPALGLDPGALAGFVRATQPREWDKLVAAHGVTAAARLAKRVAAEIDARGTVDVLRRGVKERNASVAVAYFRPTHGADRRAGRAVRRQPGGRDPAGAPQRVPPRAIARPAAERQRDPRGPPPS